MSRFTSTIFQVVQGAKRFDKGVSIYMNHCKRDPSVIDSCTGTDEKCSCECYTCQCPNCSKRYSDCKCVRHYFCTHCKRTPEEASGGACDALAGPDHDWDWTF
jgi:hypothetical protein